MRVCYGPGARCFLLLIAGLANAWAGEKPRLLADCPLEIIAQTVNILRAARNHKVGVNVKVLAPSSEENQIRPLIQERLFFVGPTFPLVGPEPGTLAPNPVLTLRDISGQAFQMPLEKFRIVEGGVSLQRDPDTLRLLADAQREQQEEAGRVMHLQFRFQNRIYADRGIILDLRREADLFPQSPWGDEAMPDRMWLRFLSIDSQRRANIAVEVVDGQSIRVDYDEAFAWRLLARNSADRVWRSLVAKREVIVGTHQCQMHLRGGKKFIVDNRVSPDHSWSEDGHTLTFEMRAMDRSRVYLRAWSSTDEPLKDLLLRTHDKQSVEPMPRYQVWTVTPEGRLSMDM